MPFSPLQKQAVSCTKPSKGSFCTIRPCFAALQCHYSDIFPLSLSNYCNFSPLFCAKRYVILSPGWVFSPYRQRSMKNPNGIVHKKLKIILCLFPIFMPKSCFFLIFPPQCGNMHSVKKTVFHPWSSDCVGKAQQSF